MFPVDYLFVPPIESQTNLLEHTRSPWQERSSGANRQCFGRICRGFMRYSTPAGSALWIADNAVSLQVTGFVKRSLEPEF